MKTRGTQKKVVIVKTTSRCNLKCPYCYNRFEDKEDLSLAIVQEFATKLGRDIGQWVWHGGEPTLVGRDFIERGTRIIQDSNPNAQISMMTNLTTYDDKWSALFRRFSIHVGSSFDGLNNDNTRKHTKKFLQKMKDAKKNNDRIGLIHVYNKDNVGNLINEYEYMKENKIYGKFNPVFKVFKAGEEDNPLVMTAQEEIDGLIKFFDYWIYDVQTEDNFPFDIGRFSFILRALLQVDAGVCHQKEDCLGDWLSLHSNGDLYPCGRDWNEKWSYGNIKDMESEEDIYKSDAYKELHAGYMKLKEECKGCPFEKICNADCPSEHLIDGTHFGGINPVVCKVNKELFSYAYEKVKNIDLLDETLLETYNPYFVNIFLSHRLLNISQIREVMKSVDDDESH